MALTLLLTPLILTCFTIDKIEASDIVLTDLVPDNVTFYMMKDDPYTQVTELYLGNKVHFKLGIHFPVGTVDMRVELFTPDNETTLMIVCDPKITYTGSNMQTSTVSPVLDSVDGSTNYDRAELDFGNVENNGSDVSTANASLIIIEWDATMIETTRSDTNGSTFWVSAGAEYNLENNIWVGQNSFVLIYDTYVPTTSPAFNMSGPDDMEIGSSAVFTLDLYVPYASASLNVDVFAPFNVTGVMSTCSITVKSTGKNFMCQPMEKLTHTAYPDSSGIGNSHSRLQLGTVINTNAREDTPYSDSVISVEFIMMMLDVPSSVGQSFLVGGTVEVGTDTIWAGQISVNAIAKSSVGNMTTVPELSLTTTGSSSLAVGQVTTFLLDIKPPVGIEGDYNIEVLMPFNSTARFNLCQMKVISYGVNVPCYIMEKPVYSSRESNTSLDMDRATWNLGKLYNFGSRSVSVDESAASLRIQITVELLNHSFNTDGEQLYVTVGVQFSTDQLWIAQNPITIDSTMLPNVTGTLPTFAMSHKFGSGDIHVGASTSVLVEMTVPPGSTYTPMNVDFLTPSFNDTAIASLCKVELVSVGDNLPCLNRERTNASISLSAGNEGESVMTSGTVSLGSVCNIAVNGTAESDADKVVFELKMLVEDNPNMVNGSQQWISAGITFGTQNIWIGQLSFTILRDDSILPPKSDNGSVYTTLEVDTITVSQGQGFSSNMFVKIPPQSTYKVSVGATFPQACGSELSICALRIAESGANLPCADTTKMANITWDSDRLMGQSAPMDPFYVTNHDSNEAVNETAVFDNNALRLVLVGRTLSTTTPGSCLLRWTVTIDGVATDTDQTITVISAVTPANSSELNLPTFDLSLASLGNDTAEVSTISPGQSAIFRLDITPVDYQNQKILIKFVTPTPTGTTPVMEMCAMNVVHAGQNIPCLQRGSISGSFESRSGSTDNDVSVLDLGYICSYPFANDIISKQVTVEGVARLRPDAEVASGDVLSLAAAIKVNDDTIYVGSINITVGDPFQDPLLGDSPSLEVPAAIVLDNSTSETDWITPGSIYNFTYSVTITPNMSHSVALDAAMPVNDSACATIISIKVVSVGDNLGCLSFMQTKAHNLTYASTQGTSQKDTAYVDLGVITNSGATYRTEKFQDGDNQMTVELLIQMADCTINEQASQVWVSVGAKVGSQLIIVDKALFVKRSGSERPEIALTGTVIDSNMAKDGDELQVEGCLSHLENSSAEVLNIQANFFLPPQLEFVGLASSNGSNSSTYYFTTGTSFGLMWNNLFFTDIICFNLTLRANCNATNTTSSLSSMAVVPFQASGSMYYRSVSTYDPSQIFYSTIRHVNFSLTLSCGEKGFKDCQEEALGMESGLIKSCQISGSTSPSNIENVRKGSTEFWVSGTRCGGYAKFIEVNFVNRTRVTRIWLEQDPPGTHALITSYKTLYSEDGMNWTPGEVVTNVQATDDHTMAFPTVSRHIRLEVVSTDSASNQAVAFRMEFYGCPAPDPNADDVCSVNDVWNIKKPPQEIKTELDSGVSNILGYDAKNSLLLAIAKDKRSYLMSQDGGTSFYSISSSKVTETRGSGQYTAAKNVPWEESGTFKMNAMPQGFVFEGSPKWGAAFDGLYCDKGSGWEKLADWCFN